MAHDAYPWNSKRSTERNTITYFLNEAQVRINAQSGAIPLSSASASATITWLRSLFDRKPSEIQSRD